MLYLTNINAGTFMSRVTFDGAASSWTTPSVVEGMSISNFKGIFGPVLNGNYILHKGSNTVAYSSNLTTWTNVSTTGSVTMLSGNGDANGWYAIIAAGTATQISTDAVTWTSGGTLPYGGTTAVCYGSGIWIAYGAPNPGNGYNISYNDGLTWSGYLKGFVTMSYDLSTRTFWGIGEVNSGNGTATLYSSTDAINWTTRYSVPASASYWKLVARQGKVMICYGQTSLYSTDNFATVSTGTLRDFATMLTPISQVGALAYDKTLDKFFVIDYDSQPTLWSSDGTNWYQATVASGIGSGTQVSFFSPQYLPRISYLNALQPSTASIVKDMANFPVKATLSGIASKINSALKIGEAQSTNTSLFNNVVIRALLAQFTSSTSASYSLVTGAVRSVVSSTTSTLVKAKFWFKRSSYIYAFSKWFGIVPMSNYSVSSSDGVNWALNSLPSVSNWSSVSSDGTTAIGIARDTNAAASTSNGTSWSALTMPANRSWYAIANNGTTFVAVSLSSGVCAVSTNSGSTWTEYAMPTMADWVGIAWNGITFSAITNTSLCATSTDGTSWTTHTMPDNITYSSITWTMGKFIAVATGPTKIAAQSTDGANWTRFNMPSEANWIQVGPGIGDINE
jgi:hypothetical protein